MKIDLVYTWVDGSDPEWIKRKEKRLQEISMSVSVSSNYPSRFIQHDELLYSLRSVYAFARWINKVYIVTDNQVPSWFNRNNDWVVIVDHKDIFEDKMCLPTFNSKAIESRIHTIPGLSEYYLYFNDDFFLGRICSKNDFFTKRGKPFVFTSSRNFFLTRKKRIEIDNKIRERNEYQAGLVNSRNLIYQKYGKYFKFTLTHGVKVFRKSIMQEVYKIFINEFRSTEKDFFRTFYNIQSFSMHNYFALLCNKAKLVVVRKKFGRNRIMNNLLFAFSKYKFIYVEVDSSKFCSKIEKNTNAKSFMFCINDGVSASEEQYCCMINYLKKLYPFKSPAEL